MTTYKKYLDDLSQVDIQTLVAMTIAKNLPIAPGNGGVSEEQVAAIVDKHIAALPKPVDQLTKEEVDALIVAATASLYASMNDVQANVQGSIEKAVAERVARFETRQPDFGLITGRHYYSPVTYAWADYYNGENSKWKKFLAFGNTLGLVVLNRSSGEWDEYDKDFHTQGRMALAAGAKRVLFYIKTRYGANAPNATTEYREKVARNLGVDVSKLDKYTHEFIIDSAKRCKELYGDIFGGILLDEVTNGWGDQEPYMDWYVDLYKDLKKELGDDAVITINPGSNTQVKMMDACDIVISYESNAEKYIDPATQYIHPDHYAGYPSWRFWHIIHGATEENIDKVFAKADALGIGHLYVTDRTFKVGTGNEDEPEENPYADPPHPFVENRVRAWINGVLPFEKRLADLEAQVRKLEPTHTPGV